MKRVCENWKEHFPAGKVGQEHFAEFETRAKNVGTEMFHVKTAAEAQEIIAKLAADVNAKKVVAIHSAYVDASGALEKLQQQNVTVYTEAADIAEHVETADLGISTVEFAIAESGIRHKDDVDFMRSHGVHTFLIGETFMRADDIAAEVGKLF